MRNEEVFAQAGFLIPHFSFLISHFSFFIPRFSYRSPVGRDISRPYIPHSPFLIPHSKPLIQNSSLNFALFNKKLYF